MHIPIAVRWSLFLPRLFTVCYVLIAVTFWNSSEGTDRSLLRHLPCRNAYCAKFREPVCWVFAEYVSLHWPIQGVFIVVVQKRWYHWGNSEARYINFISFCKCESDSPLASVSFCRNCERFLSPPKTWTLARLESSELLSICLRKLRGLNKVRLTEAHFIWTEPHSKRLRVSLTIQKEVRLVSHCTCRCLTNYWEGPHKHYSRANIRNWVSCSTWPMSRLRETGRQKCLEGSCSSPPESSTQANILVLRTTHP